MDINEQLKGWLQQQAQPGSFMDKAGLGLAKAGQTLGQDAQAGAAIMNDPRNSWIGMNPVGKAVSGGLGLGGALLGQIAYHGSPHMFEKFALSKIGTGEGAQAYGHGLYFAENPRVADSYRKILSEESSPTNDVAKYWLGQAKGDVTKAEEGLRLYAKEAGVPDDQIQPVVDMMKKPKGALYKVDLPDDAINKMMEWDKPLSAHPQEVQELITKSWPEVGNPKSSLNPFPGDTGTNLYFKLVELTGSEQAASRKLKEMGIPGIKYLDAFSRDGGGTGTRNFVVFDDQLPVVKERSAGLGLAQGPP